MFPPLLLSAAMSCR